MQNQWVDFKAIKAAVQIEAVLQRYAVQTYRVNKDHLRGKCPLPSHTSTASKLSFVVNTQKNVWSCKSESCVAARRGKSGGNVLDFVALKENCSIREAALKLAEWYAIQTHPSEAYGSKKGTPSKEESAPKLVAEKTGPVAGKETASQEENRPLSFALRGIDPCHAYLGNRGISKETAEHFGVGFFPGKGSMRGRVVIPVHNERGDLIAYAGRSIDDSEPKYKFPTGFKKSLVLFNLSRVLNLTNRIRVVIVEGFFDSMKVHQAGFPCVVALMGSTLSEAQEKLLVQNFREVVLMLDGDEAGRAATYDLGARLARKVFVRSLELPTGMQADELPSEEINRILSAL